MAQGATADSFQVDHHEKGRDEEDGEHQDADWWRKCGAPGAVLNSWPARPATGRAYARRDGAHEEHEETEQASGDDERAKELVSHLPCARRPECHDTAEPSHDTDDECQWPGGVVALGSS